jgi:nucleoside-diphosphate-sugar epimerase
MEPIKKRLSREAAGFDWRGVTARMAADFILVNGSLLFSFLLWFVFYVSVLDADPRVLKKTFVLFVRQYWLFWGFFALLVFHLHGFYTRSRAYARPMKAVAILRAVSTLVILLVFADYLLFRGALIPRGVAVLSWALMLLSVGGTRLGKHFDARRYAPIHSPRKEIRRVLVVGGAGYLGSHLVPLLLSLRFQVRVLDSLLFGADGLSAISQDENFELIKGDVRNISDLVAAVKDCDAIIHLAGIVGDPACAENPEITSEINRVATKMLIEVAKGYGVSRFVFASSCSVYGASDELVDERAPVAPISSYAVTKLDSEELLLAARSDSFDPVILRLGTLFGLSPRPRFDLVVNLLTAKAASTGSISIYNGEQWRPFLHVTDAARAFALALQSPAEIVSGQIFNVGDRRMNCRLSELSDVIAKLIPTVRVERIENADKRNYKADFTKIRQTLKFTCHVMLEEGIAEIHRAIADAKITDFQAEIFNNQKVTRAFAASVGSSQSSLRDLISLSQRPEN